MKIQMKGWLALVAISIVTISIVLLFPSGHQQEIRSKISPRHMCNFTSLEMPIAMFLPTGKPYRLKGDDNCIYTFTYLDNRSGEVRIRVGTSLADYEIHNIKSVGYLQEGLYIHVLSALPSGVRIVFTRDGKYNNSDYYNYIKKCFANPDCKLSCEDLNGVYTEGACLNGTIPLSSTDFASYTLPADKECCLNTINQPMLLLSAETYYKPEYLKVYFLGSFANRPCEFAVVSPSGKTYQAQHKQCAGLRQISNFKLLEYIGEEYGPWKARVSFDSGETIESGFQYKNEPLQTIQFNVPFNKTITSNFAGTNYYVSHKAGCGGSVELELSYLNMTESLTASVGQSILLGDGVRLIVYGASCKYGEVVVKMFRVAKPVCPNNFCENRETFKSCPWDCLNITSHNESISISDTSCTNGCYYAGKCLAYNYPILIKGVKYKCDSHELVEV